MYKLLLSSVFLILIACSDAPTSNMEGEQAKPTTAQGAESAAGDQKETPINQSPSQTIKTYDSFEDFKPLLNRSSDSIYVINFWATWCKPCVEELPYFEELNEKRAQDGVKVILVSLDFKKHLEKKLLPFIGKNDLQSEVRALFDPHTNDWIDQVSTKWSGAIPGTLIYTQTKRDFYEQSFHSFEELDELVNTYRTGNSG